MASSRVLIKSARLFHLYSGVFLTPALLFFAITGGLQTFSLHETTRGSSYKPPAILIKLGQLHKKQTLVVPERKGPPPASRTEEATPDEQASMPNKHAIDLTHLGDHTNQQKHDRLDLQNLPKEASPISTAAPSRGPQQPTPPPNKQHLLPMKIFFVIASIGLFLSTLTGLYMSYVYVHRKLYLNLALLAGIVVPVILLLVE